MSFPSLRFLPLLLPALVLAADPASPAPSKKAEHSGFIFSLLPKALQKNPRLNLNVISEVTADGKKITPPTAAQPAYYLLQPGGFMKLGEGVAHNEKSPPPEELVRLMEKSLEESHYLPSTLPEHPASLVIIFYWGSHSMSDDEQETPADAVAESGNPAAPPPLGGDKDAEAMLPQVMSDIAKQKMLYERATIVGGYKFAAELMKAIKEEADMRVADAASAKATDLTGSGPISMAGTMRPFARFRDRDDETTQLVEDTFSSCYFIIASAFEYRSVASKQKLLLWRTKMTVNSLGVSLVDTAPALIRNAGEYFGKDMTEAVTASQRVARDGHVDIGTATVVPDGTAKTPAAAPATGKSDKKP